MFARAIMMGGMNPTRASLLVLLAAVSGCQTIASSPPQGMWIRMDGVRMSGDPELEQEFYRHMSECQLAIQASQPAQISQTVLIEDARRVSGGLYEGLADARDARLRREAVAAQADALMSTCMAGRGYRYVTAAAPSP